MISGTGSRPSSSPFCGNDADPNKRQRLVSAKIKSPYARYSTDLTNIANMTDNTNQFMTLPNQRSFKQVWPELTIFLKLFLICDLPNFTIVYCNYNFEKIISVKKFR